MTWPCVYVNKPVLRLFLVAAVLFSLSSGAFSQIEPGKLVPLAAATPGSALPTAAPVVTPAPQTVAAAATPARPAPAGAPDVVPNMQFPNSDVQDVLHFYGQLTGKKLIMDNFVQGKVNIFISKPVPREEAIRIIEINLLMNGFSLVPAGNELVKVIGTGKNPRTSGVPIISDESQIPNGDQVISYLFKLRFADPQELQQVLGQYLSPPQSYTSFLALPKSSSLLITENSAVIRSLTRIIDQVDIPPAEVVSEFIKLERADASKVVEMLQEIFEKGPGTQPGTQPVPGGIRPVRPPVPQQVSIEPDVGALTALTEEAVVVGKIKMAADVRTNRIHVITRPINMPFVRKLIAEFDANVEFAKPITRPLRYISAAEVLPVLVQALTEPGTTQAGAEAGLPQPGGQPTPPRRTQGGTGSNLASGNLSSSGGDSTLNISEELSTESVDTTPKAVTVGNAKIIADQRANAIIVLGNREVVVKVQKILDEMDVKAPQVALSTVIGELTLNNDEEFGVDWFAKYKNKFVGISRNTGAPIPIPTTAPTAGATPVIVPGVVDPGGLINFGQALQQVAGGTNVYVAAGNYLATIVHFLEATGNFRVISRPMVFTSNNKKAIIASGQEIPVPVSTLTNAATTTGVAAVASSIQFKKVALQLEVVPLINSEKEVSLDILQKIDSVAGTTRVDNNDIPTVATRYIRTHVSAPNGATIVLGGLITDSKQKNYSGLPVLARIPLLGYLFRSTTNNKDRTELIILMRPQVTLTKLDLYRLRVQHEERTHFGPDLGQEDPIAPEAGKELPPPDLPVEKFK